MVKALSTKQGSGDVCREPCPFGDHMALFLLTLCIGLRLCSGLLVFACAASTIVSCEMKNGVDLDCCNLPKLEYVR